jgi:branched-chain amino acid transport system substrate-binding protein
MSELHRTIGNLQPSAIGRPLLAVCESEGPNSMDLCAAVRLALADSGSPAFVSFYDDHRSAEEAIKVADAVADAGVKYVIGHFSSNAAMAASRIYGQHGIVFLAPGSSAPELCGPSSPTTLQAFGTDDEQLDCLTDAIKALSGSVTLLAQAHTYGAELARGLLQRLAEHCTRLAVYYLTRPPESAPFRIYANDVAVVLGSQEFASSWLQNFQRDSAPQHILLSDDCFTPKLFQNGNLATRCSIAFLRKCSDTIVDQNLTSLRQRAATLLGRTPGPYFETSYIATRALATAWRSTDVRKPDTVLRDLLKQQFSSPFGTLQFSGDGRLRGHRWQMVPAEDVAALSEDSLRTFPSYAHS